jgi:O-antigen/teichoic acid export membrane protein
MKSIRHGFVRASIGRYTILAMSLLSTVIMARLVGPHEYGVYVIGGAILGIAEAVRAVGGGTYLIQHRDLSRDAVRTTVTINLIVTLIGAVVLAALAGPLTEYFDVPGLDLYLRVSALGYLLGPYMGPIFALMSRELAFGRLTAINVLMAFVNAVTTIFLAFIGFSYMSFAWASVISTVVGTLLCFQLWRDSTIYRPALSEWRGALAFGAYDSATAVFSRIGEFLPYLILAVFLSADAVALCQRAAMICLFPERVILAGVGLVALPGFSDQVRSGRLLTDVYLHAIRLITAVQWPALIVLALLAHPVIYVLLGRQWLELVPLVQVFSMALLFSFPVSLQYPALVAVGAIRYLPPLIAVQSIVILLAVTLAAPYGPRAVALSMVLAVPLNVLPSVALVCRQLGFGYAGYAAALYESAVVSGVTAAGPVFVLLEFGSQGSLPIGPTLLATFLSAIGWVAGLRMSRHPLLEELLRAGGAFRGVPAVVRLMNALRRLLNY